MSSTADLRQRDEQADAATAYCAGGTGGLTEQIADEIDQAIARRCPLSIDADVMAEGILSILSEPDHPVAVAFRRQLDQLVGRSIRRADMIQQVSDVVNIG